jgi:hypothetical protein
MGERRSSKVPFMSVVRTIIDARTVYISSLVGLAILGVPAPFAYAADFEQTLKWQIPVSVAQATSRHTAQAPKASPVTPNASGAEIVGKLLATPPSDPNVPLPRADLATKAPADRPLDGPQVFGRREEGGGVFGLKIPIPANRGP